MTAEHILGEVKAKVDRGYFHSFESPHIPNIPWQNVLEGGTLLSPTDLLLILNDARMFLSTVEGPNLKKRKIFAEEWFGWWQHRLWLYSNKTDTLSSKMCPFDRVKKSIELLTKDGLRQTGLLNVAGAEGHPGHVHVAHQMSKRVISVWAFEQDSYFRFKERPNPFLPLSVRLWMWAYSPLSLITVSPELPDGIDLNEHYQNVFDQTGIDRSFSVINDPNYKVKIRRGKPGRGGYGDNLLSYNCTASTRNRVQQLINDGIDVREPYSEQTPFMRFYFASYDYLFDNEGNIAPV